MHTNPTVYPPHIPNPPAPVSDEAAIAQATRAQVLERLVHQPPITVLYVDEQDGQIKVGYTSTPDDFRALATSDLVWLRSIVGVQIERWWRFAASTKRAWQHADTELRHWKGAKIVAAITPPPGAELETEDETPAKKGAKKAWKAPPEWQLEATYRADPAYIRLNDQVSRAEEAHTACLGVVDAWQTIGRLLAG